MVNTTVSYTQHERIGELSRLQTRLSVIHQHTTRWLAALTPATLCAVLGLTSLPSLSRLTRSPWKAGRRNTSASCSQEQGKPSTKNISVAFESVLKKGVMSVHEPVNGAWYSIGPSAFEYASSSPLDEGETTSFPQHRSIGKSTTGNGPWSHHVGSSTLRTAHLSPSSNVKRRCTISGLPAQQTMSPPTRPPVQPGIKFQATPPAHAGRMSAWQPEQYDCEETP